MTKQETQTELGEYQRAWRSHLDDFKRLKWNLKESQATKFDEVLGELSNFIDLATVNLAEARGMLKWLGAMKI